MIDSRSRVRFALSHSLLVAAALQPFAWHASEATPVRASVVQLGAWMKTSRCPLRVAPIHLICVPEERIMASSIPATCPPLHSLQTDERLQASDVAILMALPLTSKLRELQIWNSTLI